MKNRLQELYKKYKEIILYIFFGGTTTVVNWFIYILLVTSGSITVVANAIAWVGAVAYAFVTNKFFVFNSKSRKLTIILKEAVSFVLTRGLSGILEIFGPDILIAIGLKQSILGIKGALAKIVVSIIVIVLNYVFSKLLVFRNKNKPEYE